MVMTGALDGLRVLDFTTTIAGPHCTRLLADLGAEVIKIEPAEGDMMRTRPPLRNGASTSFGQLNAGKKSIVLDLKAPQAVEAVHRLLATADAVVENFRPGVMRRFGLDYEALAPIKPELIYCAISGYGQTGPSSQLPAYAPVIHAASGYDLAHMAYQGEQRRPDYCGIYIADVLTGTYAFGAILAALYQRQSTGRGQLIDVSMLESMLSLTPPGDLTLIECGHDRAKGISTGQHIGDIDAAIIGAALLALVGHVREIVSRGSVYHRRVSRQLRRWTGLTIARNRAIDEVVLDRSERLVIEAEPVHYTGPKVLDDDIGCRGEPAYRLDCLRRLEIERNALFSGIELTETGARAIAQRWARAHHVAFGRLDLDHLGSQIGEQARAMRTRDRRRKIEHTKGLQGTAHHLDS